MRFAIFTHVIHQERNGRYFAYGPYVREMNIWLRHVEEVEVVAPLRNKIKIEKEHKNDMAYQHPRLNFTKIPSFDLLTFTGVLKSILQILVIIFRIFGSMKQADHLHLRCPGNVGLLACICQIFFPKKIKSAKYAGNWDPEAQQPWTYKLQRWILNNTFLTKNITVLVYGDWTNRTENILPFFTASFSDKEKEVVIKDSRQPYKFLFVGNLLKGKQPMLALQLVTALNEGDIPAELHVYGEGPLRSDLEMEAVNKPYIYLHGNQSLDVLKKAYREAHFLVLASKSEGWPKAVAEAMFFGCIPIATWISCLPWMLNYGIRGVLAPPAPKGKDHRKEWIDEIINQIEGLIGKQEEMKRMSLEAQEWSQQYTLEKFEEAIKVILAPRLPQGSQKS